MKKRSISTKLFLVTALFFIVLLTFMMVLHTSFFESYYQWKKTSALRDNLDKIKNMYITKQLGEIALSKTLNNFEKNTGASVIFINRKQDSTFQMKAVGNNDTRNKEIAIDQNGNSVVIPDKISSQIWQAVNYK